MLVTGLTVTLFAAALIASGFFASNTRKFPTSTPGHEASWVGGSIAALVVALLTLIMLKVRF
jgi:hypothetical protein